MNQKDLDKCQEAVARLWVELFLLPTKVQNPVMHDVLANTMLDVLEVGIQKLYQIEEEK